MRKKSTHLFEVSNVNFKFTGVTIRLDSLVSIAPDKLVPIRSLTPNLVYTIYTYKITLNKSGEKRLSDKATLRIVWPYSNPLCN